MGSSSVTTDDASKLLVSWIVNCFDASRLSIKTSAVIARSTHSAKLLFIQKITAVVTVNLEHNVAGNRWGVCTRLIEYSNAPSPSYLKEVWGAYFRKILCFLLRKCTNRLMLSQQIHHVDVPYMYISLCS